MDYKEKYEQALEVAKKLIENEETNIPVFYVDNIKDIFPELKESEDEQHRKWILEYLYDGFRKSDEQFKDQFKCAIAWLEKQGQVKESDNSLTRKQRIEEAMRELEEKSKAYMEAHKGESVDKFMAMCRGEQEPINDTNEEISEELKAASILHSELVRNQSCIDEDFIAGAQWLKRQNCAWSEEDEEKFNRTLFYVKNPRQDVLKDTMLVEWLNSLKDRITNN